MPSLRPLSTLRPCRIALRDAAASVTTAWPSAASVGASRTARTSASCSESEPKQATRREAPGDDRQRQADRRAGAAGTRGFAAQLRAGRCARRRRTAPAPASPRPASGPSSPAAARSTSSSTKGPSRSPQPTKTIAGVSGVPERRLETAATRSRVSARSASVHSMRSRRPAEDDVPQRPDHRPRRTGESGRSAEGDAPGCCGAMRTAGRPGGVVKRSGASSMTASPSTPAGHRLRRSTSNSGAAHWRTGPRPSRRPLAAARPRSTATPSTPSSSRGRVPEPIARPSRYAVVRDEDHRARRVLARRPGPVQRRSSALSAGPERVGDRVEDRAQLRLAVALALHRLGVDAERDVVDEDPAVDLGEVDPALAAVDEGVERADDVVAVDAEVEREVVARAGRDAGVGQAVRRRPSPRRSPATRRRRPSPARPRRRATRGADERPEVVAGPELDGLDPARAGLVGEVGLLGLAAAGARVPEQDRLAAAAAPAAARRGRRRRRGPARRQRRRERPPRARPATGPTTISSASAAASSSAATARASSRRTPAAHRAPPRRAGPRPRRRRRRGARAGTRSRRSRPPRRGPAPAAAGRRAPAATGAVSSRSRPPTAGLRRPSRWGSGRRRRPP